MGWISAVVLLFPIPHTIAARNALILAGFVMLLASWRTGRPRIPNALRAAAVALGIATLWIIVQALTIGADPVRTLGEMRGDWLVPILVGVVAAWGAIRLPENRWAPLAVVGALTLHMLAMVVWQAKAWASIGHWPFGYTPFASYDYHSSIDGFLIALVLADRIAASRNPSIASTEGALSWPLLGFALLSDMLVRARNGTLVTIGMLVIAAGVAVRKRREWILALAAIGAIGAASLGFDPRWSGLRESVDMGWNSTSRHWLGTESGQQPLQASSGAVVEESAYLRVAWAHQGLSGIADHPLGIGFGRDAFGRLIEAKYGIKGMVSSHSGILDFTLGTGIPGLVLLLVTAGLAIRGGWHQYRRHDDPAGLMFAFLVGGYLLRCVVDGHLSGWRLGLFAFICGVLIGSMKRESRQT